MSVSSIIPFRSGPTEGSSPEVTQHVTERGETLQSVADRFGVEVGALGAANPQVLNTAEPLYPGTLLTVPDTRDTWGYHGGPMNVSTPPISSNSDGVSSSVTSTAGGSTSMSGNGNLDAGGNVSVSSSQAYATAGGSSTTTNGSVDGSVSVGNGSATVSGGADADASVKTKGGSGISFHVGVHATASSGTTTENGKTTYTVSGDVSITTGGDVTVKTGPATVGVNASHTEGSKTTYKVIMPQEVAQSTDPASINPYDPTSMPAGTAITMKGADYEGTELGATFGMAAAQISFGNKTYSASGTSTKVEKVDDHTVRVTIGPTKVVSHADTLGVSIFGNGVTLGNSFTTNSANLKTATFDLSTAEGQAAYDTYLATGELPGDNGPGVSDAAKVAVLDAEAKRELSLSLFGYDVTATLADSTMNMVQTTYPDGTSQVVTTSDAGGPRGAQLTTTQTVDADGNLVPADTTYTYALTASDSMDVALCETAFGLPHGAIEPGQQVTISFTQAQMEALQTDVKAKIALDRDKARHGYGGGGYGRSCQLQSISDNSTDPYMFAAKLASRYFCTRLETAATHPRSADMDVLPGTVSVDGTVVKQDYTGGAGGGGSAMLVY